MEREAVSTEQGSRLGRVLRNAEELLARGLAEAAADVLEGALAGDRDEPLLLRALARVRMSQGRSAEAVPLLKEALALFAQRRVVPGPHKSVAPRDPLAENTAEHSGIDAEDFEHIARTAATRSAARTRFDAAGELGHGEPSVHHDRPPVRAAQPAVLDHQNSTGGHLPVEPAVVTQAGPTLTSALVIPEPFDEAFPGHELAGEAVQGTPAPAPLSRLDAERIESRTAEPDDSQGVPSEFADEADDSPEQLALLYFDGQDAFESLDSDEPGDPESDPDEDILEQDDEDAGAPLVPRNRSVEPRVVFDWSDLDTDIEPADFDEAPTHDEVEMEVRTHGGLSRWERAQQVALEVGLEFGWAREGIGLLTEVFHLHWWSAARRSMERELAAGMAPEELRLALAVREIWRSHPEFTIDFTRVSRYVHGGVSADRYAVLSWPQALALVRSFGGLPDESEIEEFLEGLYDDWYEDSSRRQTFGSFHRYVYYRTVQGRDVAPDWVAWTFDADLALDPNSDCDDDSEFAISEYAALNSLGLIPTLRSPGPLPTVDPQAKR